MIELTELSVDNAIELTNLNPLALEDILSCFHVYSNS